MIPSVNTALLQSFKIVEQPTHTYKMNVNDDYVRGYADGIEAMKQAIYKILLTERYRYIIYSWNYGIETEDLFGEPVSYVCPELKRRITEALLWDKRIESVDDFRFDTTKRGIVAVSFTAHTVFGSIEAKREVNF